MKKVVFVLLTLLPIFGSAQGHKGKVESCAPMKNDKVCYTDQVEMPGIDQEQLFNAISGWAKETYGKDVFISSVSANRKKGTIFIGSKVELLLENKDKTIVKYKMWITCRNGAYTIEASDISYQYAQDGILNKLKSYPAESVIAQNGKGNTIEQIKNPELFCNATWFFVESLFGDVYDAAKQHAKGNDYSKVM